MSQSHDHDEEQPGKAAYETRDVKVRPLVVFTVGLAVTIVAAYLITLGVFRLFDAREAAKDASADPAAVRRAALPVEQQLPAAPRIQADPAGEYDLLRRREDELLSTYGWVDREAGLVRIPIDQAMKIVVEEGLPARQPGTTPPATGTTASTSPSGGKATKAAAAARKN